MSQNSQENWGIDPSNCRGLNNVTLLIPSRVGVANSIHTTAGIMKAHCEIRHSDQI